MQNTFDEILSTMSNEEQNHWKKHLHFIPTKVSSLGNWLTESLQGEYAIGIDRFQRIREVGYLGNPNGFTGTYMSYLAHEAIYYNSEWNNILEDESTYDEITVWERDHYTGGWASSISELVDFPSNNDDSGSMEKVLLSLEATGAADISTHVFVPKALLQLAPGHI